jgi:acyl carrier protein
MTNKKATAVEIEQWLVRWVSKALKVSAEAIVLDEPLVDLGLSSRQAVQLSGDLEEFLGTEVEPSLVWDYPTIRGLAEHLDSESGASRAP